MELAVLLPFLGLMFLAAVDFGRIFYATQTLQESAYAGALYASGTAWTAASPGPVQAAQTAACANGACLSPPLAPENVAVTTDAAAGTATVTVSYDFALLTPVLGPSGQVHLTRAVTMQTAPVPGN